jgi:hypothetical protein
LRRTTSEVKAEELLRKSNGKAGEFAGAEEYPREHCTVEAAGVSVAQRWVIAAEQMHAVRQNVLSAVGEDVGGFFFDRPHVCQVGEIAVPGDLAEAYYYSDARECGDFGGEVFGAVTDFLREGLVARRGAADDRGYPGMAEGEAVVAGGRKRAVGEAEVVEDGVHEVTGAVTGEGASGAVGAVSAWGKSNDEDACAWVSEAGDGPRPVGLVAVGAAAGFADSAAVVAQPGTALAGDDGLTNLLENGKRR